MPLKRNYHMHTELCGHATGSIYDNIMSAIKFGYEEIGFSEHAPLPLEAFNEVDMKRLYAYENISLDDMKNKYIDEINKYKNLPIKIRIGLETEYLPTYKSWYENLYRSVEYLILGVHFFEADGLLIDTYDASEMTDNNILAYANTISNALDTHMFKILAHPDLYLYSQDGFSETSKIAADIIVDAAIRNNVILEINCNGKGKYPRRDFFEYIKNRNARFIIGVDSHAPERLSGGHIENAIKLASDLNLKLEEGV